MIRLSFFKKNIDSLIAAAAGFFIIFLFTRHSGIGVCPDGVVYTTAAENLRATGKYIDFTHGPVIDFPAFLFYFSQWNNVAYRIETLGFCSLFKCLVCLQLIIYFDRKYHGAV